MNEIIFSVESDERGGCTLDELCQRIALERHFVEQCVQQGVADVQGEATEWIFSTTAVLRIRKAWRLHRDLDIHPGNLALVLELLDERDQLLQEAAALRQRLQYWEEG